MDKFDLAYKLTHNSRKGIERIFNDITNSARVSLTEKEFKEFKAKHLKDDALSKDYNGLVINNIVYKRNEYASRKSLMILSFLSYFNRKQIELISKNI